MHSKHNFHFFKFLPSPLRMCSVGQCSYADPLTGASCLGRALSQNTVSAQKLQSNSCVSTAQGKVEYDSSCQI